MKFKKEGYILLTMNESFFRVLLKFFFKRRRIRWSALKYTDNKIWSLFLKLEKFGGHKVG